MKVELSFFGIKTSVESDDKAFLDTLNSNLRFFKLADEKNSSLVDDKQLNVSYFCKRKEDAAEIPERSSKIGNNAYFDGNSYTYIEDDMVVRVEEGIRVLSISAYSLKNMSLKNIIRRNILNQKKDNFLIARKLIVFPIFYLMERLCNIHLLHGAAIEYKGKGIAFAGLGGVGKSTSSISLTLNDENTIRFLTDNYLLFDENFMYPFPEYIRIRDDMLSLIGGRSKLGEPVVRRFNRNHYILDEKYIGGKVRPFILFIPYLSEKTYVKQMPVEKAIDKLLVACDHVKEFHLHHYMGLMNYVYPSSESIYKKKLMALEKFLSGTKIYELGIKRMDKPYEWFEGIIHDIAP